MSDEKKIRKGRSGRVKRRLNATEAAQLLQLTNLPGWAVLIDVLESTCILQETELLRVNVADEKSIIRHHAKAKAAWEMFEMFQMRVTSETQALVEQEPVPELTEEQKLDREIMEICDPTKVQ